MKKNTSSKTAKPGNDKKVGAYPTGCTIGLDVSDEYTYVAVIDEAGELIGEERLRTREPELRKWLSQVPESVVALETGTHSRWIAKLWPSGAGGQRTAGTVDLCGDQQDGQVGCAEGGAVLKAAASVVAGSGGAKGGGGGEEGEFLGEGGAEHVREGRQGRGVSQDVKWP